jgi:hypothetical protein
MEFTSKNEAYLFLKDKYEKGEHLTEEEMEAIKAFFTEEELADLSFDKINVNDCVKH